MITDCFGSNGCSNCFLQEQCRFHFSCWLEALSSSCGLRVFVALGFFLVTKCISFTFGY